MQRSDEKPGYKIYGADDIAKNPIKVVSGIFFPMWNITAGYALNMKTKIGTGENIYIYIYNTWTKFFVHWYDYSSHQLRGYMLNSGMRHFIPSNVTGGMAQQARVKGSKSYVWFLYKRLGKGATGVVYECKHRVSWESLLASRWMCNSC